ncbi:hypothetical protein H0H93_012810 [Arthromyces matolae]|nr:hypothetical protein H0H93_012810 [Arthromyces matolae]
MAAGTAFAISYTSDITKVTPQNLVVFTVLYNTPWMLNATYSVPNLPACPDQGCICAWGWVPNGCGTPNMYMLPYKCKVTGVTGNAAVAPGTPAVWCEDDPSKCVVGAKQMIYWHQADGNNIQVDGVDLAGEPKSPAYNTKLGFSNGMINLFNRRLMVMTRFYLGAQRDIFLKLGSATQTSVTGTATQTSPVSSATTKPHKPHSSSSRLSIKWPLLALISILNVFSKYDMLTTCVREGKPPCVAGEYYV